MTAHVNRLLDSFAKIMSLCGVQASLHPPLLCPDQNKDFLFCELGDHGLQSEWGEDNRLLTHSTSMSGLAFGRWIAQGLSVTPGGGSSGIWTVPALGVTPAHLQQLLKNLAVETTDELIVQGFVNREKLYFCAAQFGLGKGQCPTFGSSYGPLTLIVRTTVPQGGWTSSYRFGTGEEHMHALRHGRAVTFPGGPWSEQQEVLWRWYRSNENEQYYMPPWTVVVVALVIQMDHLPEVIKGLLKGYGDLKAIRSANTVTQ
jgi:hypothetical protein